MPASLAALSGSFVTSRKSGREALFVESHDRVLRSKRWSMSEFPASQPHCTRASNCGGYLEHIGGHADNAPNGLQKRGKTSTLPSKCGSNVLFRIGHLMAMKQIQKVLQVAFRLLARELIAPRLTTRRGATVIRRVHFRCRGSSKRPRGIVQASLGKRRRMSSRANKPRRSSW